MKEKPVPLYRPSQNFLKSTNMPVIKHNVKKKYLAITREIMANFFFEITVYHILFKEPVYHPFSHYLRLGFASWSKNSTSWIAHYLPLRGVWQGSQSTTTCLERRCVEVESGPNWSKYICDFWLCMVEMSWRNEGETLPVIAISITFTSWCWLQLAQVRDEVVNRPLLNLFIKPMPSGNKSTYSPKQNTQDNSPW